MPFLFDGDALARAAARIEELAALASYDRAVDDEGRRGRLRSFLIGGLVGVVGGHRRGRRRSGRRKRRTPAGLAAFEEAPCYEETLERERTTQPDLSAADRRRS